MKMQIKLTMDSKVVRSGDEFSNEPGIFFGQLADLHLFVKRQQFKFVVAKCSGSVKNAARSFDLEHWRSVAI